MAADEIGLTGLWFVGQKYFAYNLDGKSREMYLPIFDDAKRWLDSYFSGTEPDIIMPLHLIGTDFQKKVWNILREIPYGKTVTYKEIAEILSQETGRKNMSAQAVGGAVGRNPIAVIVPCHRVIGTDGSLCGYAGGIERKGALLRLEGDLSVLTVK